MLRSISLFILLSLLLACSPESAKPPSSSPLFAARLLDSQGGMLALESYRGQPLLVNFWARWCEPCRVEIPELQRIHLQKQPQGLRVLGVALENEPKLVREFAARYGMAYPALLAGDKGNALMQALGNQTQAIPFTLAINRAGQVVGSKIGLLTRAEAEALAKAALTP